MVDIIEKKFLTTEYSNLDEPSARFLRVLIDPIPRLIVCSAGVLVSFPECQDIGTNRVTTIDIRHNHAHEMHLLISISKLLEL